MSVIQELHTPYQDLLPPLAQHELDALRQKIDAEGYNHNAPILIDENGNVLDGHNRLRIYPDAPVQVIPGLTEAQKRARVITENFARRNLSPDQKREVDKTRRAIAMDLKREGQTQEQIARVFGVAQNTVHYWLGEPTTNINADNGCIPDSRVKVAKGSVDAILERANRGETQSQIAADYGVSQQAIGKLLTKIRAQREREEQRAENTRTSSTRPVIELADAKEWLERQGEVDLLLTDPPYSTDVDDIASFAASWLPLALSKVKPTGRAYVFIGAYPLELAAYLNISVPQQILVWTYRNTLGPTPKLDYKINWQACLYYRGPNAAPLSCDSMMEQFSVQDISAPDGRQGDRYHAWQKPIEIAERFVRHSTNQGDIVIDPFACTGTFLIAAASLGRTAFGCDISKENLDLAEARGCDILKPI